MWSTFIHRGSTDDVTERREAVVGRDLLSSFQQAGPGLDTGCRLPCTSRYCCYQKMELDERLTVMDQILAKFPVLIENI